MPDPFPPKPTPIQTSIPLHAPPATVLPPPYTGNTQTQSRYLSHDLESTGAGDPYAQKTQECRHAQSCVEYHEREKRKKGQVIYLCLSVILLVLVIVVVVNRVRSQND